jgi:hypothetical protein
MPQPWPVCVAVPRLSRARARPGHTRTNPLSASCLRPKGARLTVGAAEAAPIAGCLLALALGRRITATGPDSAERDCERVRE